MLSLGPYGERTDRFAQERGWSRGAKWIVALLILGCIVGLMEFGHAFPYYTPRGMIASLLINHSAIVVCTDGMRPGDKVRISVNNKQLWRFPGYKLQTKIIEAGKNIHFTNLERSHWNFEIFRNEKSFSTSSVLMVLGGEYSINCGDDNWIFVALGGLFGRPESLAKPLN